MCFLIHKWDKWKEIIKTFEYRYDGLVVGKPFGESWQQRTCLKCGKIKQRKID